MIWAKDNRALGLMHGSLKTISPVGEFSSRPSITSNRCPALVSRSITSPNPRTHEQNWRRYFWESRFCEIFSPALEVRNSGITKKGTQAAKRRG